MQRGQRTKLGDLVGGDQLELGIAAAGPGMHFEVGCVGLDASGRSSDPRYLVSAHQHVTPDGAVTLGGARGEDHFVVRLLADVLPPTIDKVLVVLSVVGDQPLRDVTSAFVRALGPGGEVGRWSFDGSELGPERAIIVGELYRKDGWRLGLPGTGYAGGIPDLLQRVGATPGAPAAPPPAPAPAVPSPAPAPVPGPAPGAPPAGYGPTPGPAPVPSPVPGAAPGYAAPAPAYGQPGPGAPAPAAIPPGAPAADGAIAALFSGGADTSGRFALANPKCLRVTLGDDVVAYQGSMISYRGQVDFDHEGAGLGKWAKKALTGEGVPLMRCTGNGEVWFARGAANVHLVRLNGERFTVSGKHVMAFDPTLQWDIRRVEGVSMMGAGVFNMEFSGHGALALVTHGPPVVLPCDGWTFVDANAVVGWTAGAKATLHRTMKLKALIGRGSGEAFQLRFEGQGSVIVQPSEL